MDLIEDQRKNTEDGQYGGAKTCKLVDKGLIYYWYGVFALVDVRMNLIYVDEQDLILAKDPGNS